MFTPPDIKKLNDEQLYKTITDVSNKLSQAVVSKMNYGVISQLRIYLQELQDERTDRQTALWEKQLPNDPKANLAVPGVVVETDPSMVNVPLVLPKK